MYKDEMIQIHQFLVYMLKYLENGQDIEFSCKEYISLNISPHHIHKTKAEHKHAIFVLSNTISEVVRKEDSKAIPDNVSNSLYELVQKVQKKKGLLNK